MVGTGPTERVRGHQCCGGAVGAVGQQQQLATEPVRVRRDQVGFGVKRPGALVGGISRGDKRQQPAAGPVGPPRGTAGIERGRRVAETGGQFAQPVGDLGASQPSPSLVNPSAMLIIAAAVLACRSPASRYRMARESAAKTASEAMRVAPLPWRVSGR